MNEKFALALEYIKRALLWCKENPKIVSTVFLALLAFCNLLIVFSTEIPSHLIDKNEAKNSLKDRFVDLEVNSTQLEWIISNCAQLACIEDKCYCLTRLETSWLENHRSCFEESGLTDARLFTPLETGSKGMFDTYRDLIGFLSYGNGYIPSMWTGLSRDQKADTGWIENVFQDERGRFFDWFHTYKTEPENSRTASLCVQKISSKGFARSTCLNNDELYVSGEFIRDILSNQSNDQFLSWTSSSSRNSIVANAKILCQIDLNSLSPLERETIENNTDSEDVLIQGLDDNVRYFLKDGFSIWSMPSRIDGSCEIQYRDLFVSGYRAIIHSRQEEQFILNSIPDIFLEIGLSAKEEKAGFVLEWDKNMNGVLPSSLQWYYEEKYREGTNCLASDPFSSSDLKLDWVAENCRQQLRAVCTFKPTKLKDRSSKAAEFPKKKGVVTNEYVSYFCTDPRREKCYAAVDHPISRAKDFIRTNNFKVAVVKSEQDKKLIAQKLRPLASVFVGASSMLKGDDFHWMYDDEKVSFTAEEREYLEEEDQSEKVCLVLGSDGKFASAFCDTDVPTLIALEKGEEFIDVRMYFPSWY